MKSNIVNFNKARKQKARHEKVLKAAENRVKFGRTKSQKDKTTALTQKLQNHLDRHKQVDGVTDDDATVNDGQENDWVK